MQKEIIPGLFALAEVESLNQSQVSVSGPIDIITRPEQWSFAAAFPFRPRALSEEVLLVAVEVEVHRGRIGIGCVHTDFKTYLAAEKECGPEEGHTVVDLSLGPSEIADCGWLVIRNTAGSGQSSGVTVRSIRTFRTGVRRIPDLVEVEPAPIPQAGFRSRRVGSLSRRAATFHLLLTHTSRKWDGSACSREYLSQRYADPGRLSDLPPFDQLAPPADHLYSGGLSLLELNIDGDSASLVARRSIDSPYKIQHAAMAGGRVVLCFENFLAVLPSADARLENVDLGPGSPWRIDDNWFGGLHTVFAINRDLCLVSSSSADAVLWVDLASRKAIRRWRLPSELYGRNYDLLPSMSVNRHHIPNDIQLGHLNCAFPDGKGGCYVSTLAQGDIGRMDERGGYALLARGYVGCHGIRATPDGRGLYFSDSCNGALMQLDPDGSVRQLWATESQWLHDAEQLDSDLFLLCLGDRNELALVDLANGEELCRFSLANRGVNVQFVSVIREWN